MKKNIINDLSDKIRYKNKIIDSLTKTNIILSLKLLRLEKELSYYKRLRKR